MLRDDFASESDVDVLVELQAPKTPSLFGMARMQRELGEIIGRTVDFKTKASSVAATKWSTKRGKSMSRSQDSVRLRYMLEREAASRS